MPRDDEQKRGPERQRSQQASVLVTMYLLSIDNLFTYTYNQNDLVRSLTIWSISRFALADLIAGELQIRSKLSQYELTITGEKSIFATSVGPQEAFTVAKINWTCRNLFASPCLLHGAAGYFSVSPVEQLVTARGIIL